VACYHPISAWRGEINPSGKRKLVFDKTKAKVLSEIQIPCGQCVGCRLERSRQWAMRCLDESQLYDRNCFITLTYDEKNIPSDGSLYVEHFQKFMKRLRKAYPKDRIRFFHCGEYGDQNGRPHYHACLFNFDFDDKVKWSEREGNTYYISPSLNRIWKYGYCIIGEVTFESAAYVARYIMKKINGEKAEEHYKGKKPEYTTMSRRPGIGRGWYDKYKKDLFPHDYKVVNGHEVNVPKFYSNIYELESPEEFKKVKERRESSIAFTHSKLKRLAGYGVERVDNSYERLQVKEFIKRQRIKSLIRTFEI